MLHTFHDLFRTLFIVLTHNSWNINLKYFHHYYDEQIFKRNENISVKYCKTNLRFYFVWTFHNNKKVFVTKLLCNQNFKFPIHSYCRTDKRKCNSPKITLINRIDRSTAMTWNFINNSPMAYSYYRWVPNSCYHRSYLVIYDRTWLIFIINIGMPSMRYVNTIIINILL